MWHGTFHGCIERKDGTSDARAFSEIGHHYRNIAPVPWISFKWDPIRNSLQWKIGDMIPEDMKGIAAWCIFQKFPEKGWSNIIDLNMPSHCPFVAIDSPCAFDITKDFDFETWCPDADFTSPKGFGIWISATARRIWESQSLRASRMVP